MQPGRSRTHQRSHEHRQRHRSAIRERVGHLAVTLGTPVPDLEHVAQHHDLPPRSLDRPQRPDRRQHRVRVRVVRVVDDLHTADRAPLQSHRRRLDPGQPRARAFHIDTEPPRHRQRPRRIDRVVPAQHRQLERSDPVDRERHPRRAAPHARDAKVHALALPERDQRPRAVRVRQQLRHVAVDDRRTARADVPQQRSLLPHHTRDRSEPLQVRPRDRRNDRNVRPNDPRQPLDLARVVRPELAHEVVVARARVEQRQRDAQRVVETLERRRPAKRRPQRRVDHPRRCRLAVRARDRDHARAHECVPVRPGQRDQRVGNIFDHQHAASIRQLRRVNVALDHRNPRPRVRRLPHVPMPVRPLAAHGEENLPGRGRARVDRRPASVAPARRLDQPSPARRRPHPLSREEAHAPAVPIVAARSIGSSPRSRSAAAATSESSKCRRTVEPRPSGRI